jgi:hypothetical protein
MTDASDDFVAPSGDAPSAAAAGKSTEVEHDPVVIKATFDWGYKKEHAEIRASEMGWLDRSRLQPAAAREADPVAYRISQGAGWNYYDTLNERQLTRFKELGWFIEPLYASPVPSSSERSALLKCEEALRGIIDSHSADEYSKAVVAGSAALDLLEEVRSHGK